MDTIKREKKFIAAAYSENKTGIPYRLKNGFEAISCMSFDDVRVHYNSSKPERVNAYAYTRGNHVYIAPGQERHLPHELGHVLQQKRGRVRATAYLGHIAVNDNAVLEREASHLGIMAGKSY